MDDIDDRPGVMAVDLDQDGEVDLIAIDLDRDGEADLVLGDVEPEEDDDPVFYQDQGDVADLVETDLERDEPLVDGGADEDFSFDESEEDFQFDSEESEPVDSDQDGLSDALEAELGTNAFNEDTDGDGLLDGQEDANQDGWHELGWETDPLSADTDRDGISDGIEDRDHDGMRMAGETDALDADSDHDGVKDGQEDRNSDGSYQPDLGETDATDGHSYDEADRNAYVDETGYADYTAEDMDGTYDPNDAGYDDGTYDDGAYDDGTYDDGAYDDVSSDYDDYGDE